MDGPFALLKTTILVGAVFCIGGVAAVHHLAGLKLGDVATVAAAPERPRQSIEGLRSVLDPASTGSISRPTVVLDPCTGQKKP